MVHFLPLLAVVLALTLQICAVSTIAIISATYEALSSMLAPDRTLVSTPLQLELLGITSNLYKSVLTFHLVESTALTKDI